MHSSVSSANAHRVISIGNKSVSVGLEAARRLSRGHWIVESIGDLQRYVDSYDPASLLVAFVGRDVDELIETISMLPIDVGIVFGQEESACWRQLLRILDVRSDKEDLDVVYQSVEGGPRHTLSDGLLWLEGSLSKRDGAVISSLEKRLFAVSAHSDGYSMQFGEGVICSRLVNSLGDGPLFCHQTEICGRLHRPILDLAREGTLISPDEIRADVFLNLTCWGARFSGLAGGWSTLGAAFSNCSGIGHMILALGPLALDKSVFLDAIWRLRAGESLGAVTRFLNIQTRNRGSAAAVALIGDPAFSMGSASITPVASLGSTPCAQGQMPNTPDANSQDFASLLLARVIARLKEDIQHGERDLPKRLIAALTAQALTHGSLIMHDWCSFGTTSVSGKRDLPCPNCGRRAVRCCYRLTNGRVLHRYVTSCISCGIVSDEPVDSDALRIEISNGLGRIAGSATFRAIPTITSAILEGGALHMSLRLQTDIQDGTVVFSGNFSALDIRCLRILSIFSWTDQGLSVHRVPIIGPNRVTDSP